MPYLEKKILKIHIFILILSDIMINFWSTRHEYLYYLHRNYMSKQINSYITQQLKHFKRNTILPDAWALAMLLMMNHITGNCSLTKERI